MNDLSLDLQSLINVHETPFVLIDKDYRVVSANHAYCQVYGLSPDEIVGRLCHEISHHSSIPCHENGEVCPHQKVFATGDAAMGASLVVRAIASGRKVAEDIHKSL